MSGELEPTETYDGRITVQLLNDTADNEAISCSSYEDAIDVVKENQHAVTAAKIVSSNGNVVFSSADAEIDVWESIWRNEKRRLSVEIEEHDCPYDSLSCFNDDLCVECQMDHTRDGVGPTSR